MDFVILKADKNVITRVFLLLCLTLPLDLFIQTINSNKVNIMII